MDLLAKMATYVRVIESGSLSAAAKQRRISLAAVSRQIATLERMVGTPLIARTTRKMSVTAAGQRYYERCLRILRDVDDAQTIGGTEPTRPLRISAPITFGLANVVPRLRSLIAAEPTLRIEVRLEDRVVDLVLEGVDVAIRVATSPPISTEIIAVRLCEFRRVIVAAPSYLAKHGEPKTPAALAKHAALLHAVGASPEEWNLIDANGANPTRVRLDVRAASNANLALRDMAIDGVGIALLPLWFIADEVAAKRLKVLLPGWGTAPVLVHALYRTGHRSEQQMKLLIEHLRKSYARSLGV